MAPRKNWQTYLHRSGMIVGFLSTAPLVVFWLFSLRNVHGWRAAVLLLLLMVASWAIQALSAVGDSRSSLNEMPEYLSEFPGVTFVSIPQAEILAALHARSARLRAMSDQDILPTTSRLQTGRIRYLVALVGDGPVPASLVSYSSAAGAWIILQDFPENLTNLQFFMLLHEIGHSAMTSVVARLGSSVAVIYVLLALFLVALQMNPNTTQLAVLAGISSAWFVAASANIRFLRARARLYDEIAADHFAFERVDPDWLSRYPAQSLARSFCEGERGPRPTTPVETQRRQEIFLENLRLIQAGRHPRTLRELLSDSKWSIWESLLVCALFAYFGWICVPLSNVRLVLLAIAVSVSAGMALVCGMVMSMNCEMADHVFGIKKADSRVIALAARSFALRRKIKAKFVREPLQDG